MGHDNLFDCRISRIAPEEHPEEQIQLTVRIRSKEDVEAEIERANNRSTQINRRK